MSLHPITTEKSPEVDNLHSFFIDFVAGGVSATVAKTVLAPLDRVKLLLQTQHVNVQLQGREYTGIINCFTRVIKEEGVFALWRGNLSNVIRFFPSQAILFPVKDALEKYLCQYDSKEAPIKFFIGNLASGGLSGAFTDFFVYPLDFARTRIGSDMGRGLEGRQFKGIVDCLKKTIKKTGAFQIYQGFPASVMGIFIYRALYFGGYDAGKKLFFSEESTQIPFWKRYVFAQGIVAAADTLSFPFATVRRRLMMQVGRKRQLYSGTIDCGLKILKHEGITGFYKGGFANIFRSFGSSLVLVLYDEFQQILKYISNR